MRKTGLILTVIGLLFFYHAEGWGADWKLFSTIDLGDFYYDAESITYPSKNTVRVWEKVIWTEKGVMEMFVEQPGGEKFKTLSYSISLYELHCAEKKERMSSVVLYSKDGGVALGSHNYQDLNWEFITPDTVLETLYEKLCK